MPYGGVDSFSRIWAKESVLEQMLLILRDPGRVLGVKGGKGLPLFAKGGAHAVSVGPRGPLFKVLDLSGSVD